MFKIVWDVYILAWGNLIPHISIEAISGLCHQAKTMTSWVSSIILACSNLELMFISIYAYLSWVRCYMKFWLSELLWHFVVGRGFLIRTQTSCAGMCEIQLALSISKSFDNFSKRTLGSSIRLFLWIQPEFWSVDCFAYKNFHVQ